MKMIDPILPLTVFLSVGAAALFTFVAVVAWSDARRAERETYYKSEVLKKIAESQAPGAAAALDYLRAQENTAARQRHDGLKLGGLMSAAVGAGLMIVLKTLVPPSAPPVFVVGLIPLLVGLVLLGYAYAAARRQ
jgi:hypothetical protein